MPGRGFPPSGHASRSARNARDVITAARDAAGWPLPAGVLGDDDSGQHIQWHPATVAWWETWRSSPQASRMLTEPDWMFLLDTALIHHRLWSGQKADAAELRLRVAKFGATPEDRQRLRVDVEASTGGPELNPAGQEATPRTGQRRRYRAGDAPNTAVRVVSPLASDDDGEQDRTETESSSRNHAPAPRSTRPRLAAPEEPPANTPALSLDYAGDTVPVLQNLARRRDLSDTGSHSTLVARLEAADRDAADDPDSPPPF